MRNIDKIKAMDIDEMANFLPIAGEYCEVCIFRYSPLCTEKMTIWIVQGLLKNG